MNIIKLLMLFMFIQQTLAQESNDTLINKYLKRIPAEEPKKNELGQKYPDPFCPSTTIKFSIAEDTKVKLSFFDTSGTMLGVPVEGKLKAGVYEFDYWDDFYVNVKSGVYYYRLETDSFTDTKRFILVK